MRRIGVLIGLAEDDPETKARLAGFRQGLEKRGWSEGRNLQIDYRFAPASSADQAQALANELVADLELPMLLPGIKVNTSPTDYYPVQQLQLMRFDGKRWVRFGDLLYGE
jgi:hypothetical protein